MDVIDEIDEDEHTCDYDCSAACDCGRGRYRRCKHRSCYECYLDRLSDFRRCLYCGRWHNPEFDACFTCRPETRGRDDPARALRQLVLWRDQYACRYCGAVEGDMQLDPRMVRAACLPRCRIDHKHRMCDDDGMRHTLLHVDHIIPCAAGGQADEWNLQVLCSVCNIAKGATWYPGCRHDKARSELCRGYFLIAKSYFPEPDRSRFLAEVEEWRGVRTWDPSARQSWRDNQEAAPAH